MNTLSSVDPIINFPGLSSPQSPQTSALLLRLRRSGVLDTSIDTSSISDGEVGLLQRVQWMKDAAMNGQLSVFEMASEMDVLLGQIIQLIKVRISLSEELIETGTLLAKMEDDEGEEAAKLKKLEEENKRKDEVLEWLLPDTLVAIENFLAVYEDYTSRTRDQFSGKGEKTAKVDVNALLAQPTADDDEFMSGSKGMLAFVVGLQKRILEFMQAQGMSEKKKAPHTSKDAKEKGEDKGEKGKTGKGENGKGKSGKGTGTKKGEKQGQEQAEEDSTVSSAKENQRLAELEGKGLPEDLRALVGDLSVDYEQSEDPECPGGEVALESEREINEILRDLEASGEITPEEAVDKEATRFPGFRLLVTMAGLGRITKYQDAEGNQYDTPEEVPRQAKVGGHTLQLVGFKKKQCLKDLVFIPARLVYRTVYFPEYKTLDASADHDAAKVALAEDVEGARYPLRVEGVEGSKKRIAGLAPPKEPPKSGRKKATFFLRGTAIKEHLIAGSYVTPELLAYIIMMVCIGMVPVCRLLAMPAAIGTLEGGHLCASVVAGWIILAYERKLKYMMPVLEKALLSQGYLHADETTLQVLNEEGRDNRTKSYMWLYSTLDNIATPVRYFAYAPGRQGEIAAGFLASFTGVLITDAYAGYNLVKGVDHAFCVIHARRKFFDAVVNGSTRSYKTKAARCVRLFNRLFEIERGLKDLTPEERLRERQKQMRPILDALEILLISILNDPTVSKKSKLYRAASYYLDNKDELTKFMTDGNIPMHNMMAEHMAKRVALYRKNSLFCGSPRGAVARAGIFTIVETAKANGLDPYLYLVFLFDNLRGDASRYSMEYLESLAPWGDKAQAQCRSKALPKEKSIDLVGGQKAA